MGFLPLGRQASIPARRRRACLPAGRPARRRRGYVQNDIRRMNVVISYWVKSTLWRRNFEKISPPPHFNV